MRMRLRWPELSGQGSAHYEPDPAPDGDGVKRSYNPADGEWPRKLYRDALKDRHRAAHLLQLLLSSQEWVHRRVEAVIFHDGTTATRRVSVDFSLPSQAPICAVCASWPGATDHHSEEDATKQGGGEMPPRLVPITLLPKRNLVNFDLRDEGGAALPHLALRQNQDLTYTMLYVWAQHVLATGTSGGQTTTAAKSEHTAAASVRLHTQVTKALESFTYGDRDTASAALELLRKPGERDDDQLQQLAGDPLFRYVLELLAYDFMLIVEVPDKPPYRHVYKMSYDTSFLPKYPTKHRTASSNADAGRWEKWREEWRNWRQKQLTAFGWRETSFEFDTPEAKLAQSYHLKVQVPESVEISEAVLLAGSQNDEKKHHLDIAGGRPTVDLHVVEVHPHQSARARVDLKARRSGWLGSACLAGLIAFAAVVLVSGQLGALYPWFGRAAGVLDLNEVTLLATILAALSALLATMLTRPNEHPMASALLYLLRPLSSLAMLLPFVAATVLVLVHEPNKKLIAWPFAYITVFSGLLAVVLLVAWLKGRRNSSPTISPWQQDIPESVRHRLKQRQRRLWFRLVPSIAPQRRTREADDLPANYEAAELRYGFGEPAVETEIRRHQVALHKSPKDATAALVGGFHPNGCPRT